MLREVGAELQADPAFGPSILAPIEMLGVDAFADWSVVMKLRIKTVPLKQWDVGRELRRRIMKAFEQQGIEIPFPVPVDVATPAAAPEQPDRGSVAGAVRHAPASALSIPGRS